MIPCNTYYTLALLGRFEPDQFLYGFIHSEVIRHQDSNQGFSILLGLLSNNHVIIAERILQLKRIFYNLRLEVVIRSQQQTESKGKCSSIKGQTLSRIITNADSCHVIHAYSKALSLEEMSRFFSSHANEIVCASKFEMPHIKNQIYYRSHKPKIVLYVPRLYHELRDLRSAWLLAHSIDYIRESQFKVMANKIPDDLLTAWLADDDHLFLPYFGRMDETADLLRMIDDEGRMLPFKIFAYAYSVHNDLWAFGYPRYEEVKRRFGQFQTLLQRITAARKVDRKIGVLNILEFPKYDSAIKKTKWVDKIIALHPTTIKNVGGNG